ncbi:PQQ-dependent sugar dehydrogenase [Nocardioides insulae]|uniref:PQQ-dependent sugar dehydrogenase n=1 Tax=Nocardioides insulae TaxID=394734 RepID=UPI0004281C80|nr:PQQ-dependent sugar dehydrogenase [Nocardioides insulae]
MTQVVRRSLLRAGLAAPLAALAACAGEGEPAPAPTSSPTGGSPSPSAASPSASATPSGSPSPRPQVAGTLLTDAQVPWGIAFLPGGDALVSMRDTGEIVLVRAGGGRSETVRQVPGIEFNGTFGGEGGLLGIALHPDGGWLYAYLTTSEDNRVIRMPWPARDPDSGHEVVLEGIAKNTYHNGGALAFGPDGMLYVSTGDAGDSSLATDRDSLNGKILRISPAGGVPADNPFGNEVWSLGHRNVEGLAFAPDGELWASEFGDKAFDEVNRIVRGGDYGWPASEGSDGQGGGRDPLAQWPTDECSPAGIAIAAGHAWLGALQGECLMSVDLSTGESRRHLTDHGRIRLVATAPDGSLWVGTSNRDGRGDPRDGDDRILRVTL